MRVWMLWHGGASYAVGDRSDIDEFESIAAARGAFEMRTWSSETYYPCVSAETPDDGGPTGWLFFADPRGTNGDLYPDRVLEFGPRGGLRMYPA